MADSSDKNTPKRFELSKFLINKKKDLSVTASRYKIYGLNPSRRFIIST
jgi:hypothetical protein